MKSNFVNKSLLIIFIVLCSQINFAQIENARDEINNLVKHVNGKIGVAVMDLDNLDTLTVNNDHCFPMQSVYKFPLALAVLSEVDKGNLSLDQEISLTKENLFPNTWSPLREKYQDANIEVKLSEVLEYVVAQSDNNGCDILFNLIGGPAKVNEYITGLGIKGISILNTEAEMHKDWNIQYKNCSNPSAMTDLFYKFAQKNILSSASKDFIWNIMTQNVFGSKRIIGQLPDKTVVAHKTGSSGTNKEGIAAATNDAGIVTLPDGRQFAIVVFVSDSPDDADTRDKIIADIAKIVWDVYSN